MPCACHCPLVQSWKVSWLLFTSIGLGTSHLDQVPKTNVGWQANKWSSTLFILFPWAPNWMDLGHGTEAKARYVPFWIIFLQASFLIEFFKMMLSGKYLFAYIAQRKIYSHKTLFSVRCGKGCCIGKTFGQISCPLLSILCKPTYSRFPFLGVCF